ncbi:MAG: ABC transporter permease [Thauera sp.]
MLGTLLSSTRLAARNLARQRRRTLLALATLCGGVVAYLLAGGFIQWILHDMRETTIHAQLGHIQITRPHYLSEGLSDPYNHLLPATDARTLIGGMAEIVTVTPRLAFGGLISKGDATVSFVGEGIAPRLEAPIARAINIVKGADLTESEPRSVLMGEGLAANLGTSPGDTVVLLVTTASGGVNAVELKVAGLFATTTKEYDDTVLRMPIDIARQLMRVGGATSWVILLDQTESTDRVVSVLQQTLPASEFEVIPWHALADFYNKTVELFSKQVGVVRLLIALIVILSISNTLSMTVVERTGEIGTSMALGVTRARVLLQFLCEGTLLGLVGGALGVALGHIVSEIISLMGIPMPPPPGMARGYTGAIRIPLSLTIDAFLLGFVTTLAASALPAWRASRLNIVDALRHQR